MESNGFGSPTILHQDLWLCPAFAKVLSPLASAGQAKFKAKAFERSLGPTVSCSLPSDVSAGVPTSSNVGIYRIPNILKSNHSYLTVSIAHKSKNVK